MNNLHCETCKESGNIFKYPCKVCTIQLDGLGSNHTSRPNPCDIFPDMPY